jgi:hypothetical protein
MNTVLPAVSLQKESMVMKLRRLKTKLWQIKIKGPKNLLEDMRM